MTINRVDVRRNRLGDGWECQVWVIRNEYPTRWPSLDRVVDTQKEAIELRDEMMNGN